jgi:hypothetical protein
MSRQLFNLRLPGNLLERVLEICVAETRTKTDVVLSMIADGLKQRMIDRGVARSQLDYLAPEAVIGEFDCFVDAVCTRAGLPGPMGNVFRIENTPDGDFILRENEIVVNGEVYGKAIFNG